MKQTSISGRSWASTAASARDRCVVSGHTYQPYSCILRDPAGKPRLVTSAASYGRLVSDIHLVMNTRTGDVFRPAAWNANRIVRQNVPADSAVQRLVGAYTRLVREVECAVIGYTAGSVTDTDGRTVTYGAACTVQPFNNYVVSMDMTGDPRPARAAVDR